MRPPSSRGGRTPSERIYHALLYVYPLRFREQSGPEMQEVFRDSHAASARHGVRGLTRLWARTLVDLLASVIPEHLAAIRRHRPSHRPPMRQERTRTMMDHVVQDVRYALRAIMKQPAFAGVVVLTLALGIGANTAIFSLINEVLLRPLPIVEPGRIAAVYTTGSSGGLYSQSSYPDYIDFRDQSDAFTDMAAFMWGTAVNLTTDETTEPVSSAVVSGNYFGLLGIQPAVGRLLVPDDDVTPGAHAVAVLGHETWRRRFGGDSSIVGATIILNGTPFTVVGVAARGFRGTVLGGRPEVWLPLKMAAIAAPFFERFPVFEERGARWLEIVGRLQPDATLEQARVELNTVMARLADEYPGSNRGTRIAPDEPRGIQVIPAHEAAVGGGLLEETVERAGLLLGIVGLVLFIACANVANMLLARGRRRRREVAVRLAMGASRGRLMRQMLTESALLGTMAGGVGLAFALWSTRVLIPMGLTSALSDFVTVETLTLDGRVLGFTLGMSLLTGMLFGTVPAWRATRPDLVSSLRDGGSGGGRRARRYGLRDALVVVQVGSSLVLLIGAGLFVRSLQAAYSTQLGFNPDGVLLTSLNVALQDMEQPEGEQFFHDVLEGVSQIPGVRSASFALNHPVQAAGSRAVVQPEGYQPQEGEEMELSVNLVTPGYFETLQIPLLQGGTFTAGIGPDAPTQMIVNESFAARFWPGENALGKRVRVWGGQTAEVIGVTANGKYRNIREDNMPYYYLAASQFYQPGMTLAVRVDGEPTAVFPSVRAMIRRLDPSIPLTGVVTLREHLGHALVQERTMATLISALGLLALAVAAVGMYGVMAYAVSQRTREIGIRTALGARSGDVLSLVVGQGTRLAAMGVVTGALAALALSGLVARFLFGVQATDPTTFAAVIGILAAVALLASYIPARRAAKVDPMQALRYE